MVMGMSSNWELGMGVGGNENGLHFLCLLLDASLNIGILLTLLAHRARSRLFYSNALYKLLTYLITYYCMGMRGSGNVKSYSRTSLLY